MKKILFFISSLIIFSTTQASGWQIGAGFYYADISGINAYEASANNNSQDTKNFTVPSLFIAKSFNEKFNIVYRYTSYNDIISNGVSGDSNIFNQPNFFAPQVISYYSIFEKLNENSFSFNYAFINNDRWKIEAGPSVSIAFSKAIFFRNSNSISQPIGSNDELVLLRKFSETSYAIGGEVNASLKLSEKANLNFNYRYTSPSKKNIHLFGVSVSLNF